MSLLCVVPGVCQHHACKDQYHLRFNITLKSLFHKDISGVRAGLFCNLQDDHFISLVFSFWLFGSNDVCLPAALAADFVKAYASLLHVVCQAEQFSVHFLVPVVIEVAFKYAVLHTDYIVFQFFRYLSPQFIA